MSQRSPVIIYRLGSLGDTIVALPCFHRIERSFPGRERIALTNIPVASNAAPLDAILRPGGFISGSIEYPLGLRSPRRLLSLRKRLRAIGSDTLVYLPSERTGAPAWRDQLFFRMCGFKNFVGFPNARARTGPGGAVEPEAERLARSIVSLGSIDLSDRRNWDLRITHEEETRAGEALAEIAHAPFFAINMGGKAGAAKDWGRQNWLALISRIRRDPAFIGWALVVVGAEADSERAQEVLAHWAGAGIDLCGRAGPRECAAVLRRAHLFVGHDSGPLHLAACMQTRTVGLFGNFNKPTKWHPYGPGHSVLHEMRGIGAITVESVCEAVKTSLERCERAPTGREHFTPENRYS